MIGPDAKILVLLILRFFKKVFIFDCTGSSLMHEAFLLSSGGYSLIVVYGLWSTGSVVVSKGFSCPRACGIFLDQELNQSPTLASGFLITGLGRKSSPEF